MSVSLIREFYVYALFDLHGIVRYIGKGKKGRWTQHQTSKRGRLPFIDETFAVLGDIPKVKIHENLSEFEAYSFENALISAIGIAPNGPLFNKTAKGSGPNSGQVKSWHASRTPEERVASIRKIALSMSIEAISDRGRRNALSIGRETLSERMTHQRQAQTADERSQIGRSGGLASAKALTASQRSERSMIARLAYMTNTTPEERQANALRSGALQQTKDQLAHAGRKGAVAVNASRSPEERSHFARKAALRGAEIRRAKAMERSGKIEDSGLDNRPVDEI